MSYIKEPFENLDVMSDFLNNALASNPIYGKDYCRIMIKNLTGIIVNNINVITQKVINPSDPNKRGIRLDIEVREYKDSPEAIVNIYDIEPHRNNDVDNYAKKSRFYQAKMDSQLLKSGEQKFNNLPNLFIISITNFDPFDDNYMIYTIKNKCVELPEMCYDDGVTIFYFNTTGIYGGSPELKAFLTYLDESTDQNIVNDSIQELANFVNLVKDNPVEKDGYMTWGDKIDQIVADAVAEKDSIIAQKDSTIAEKDNTIAQKDAEILRLKKELEKNK